MLFLPLCEKKVLCKTPTELSVGIWASSADPDNTPQNAASDQGLHCVVKLHEVKG